MTIRKKTFRKTTILETTILKTTFLKMTIWNHTALLSHLVKVTYVTVVAHTLVGFQNDHVSIHILPVWYCRITCVYRIFWKLISAKNWPGDQVYFKVNGETVATLEYEFQTFDYCLGSEDDEFQLESSGNNGVCITSLIVNGEKMQFGANNDLSSFWIESQRSNFCLEDAMSTSQITIKNGKIQSSECNVR